MTEEQYKALEPYEQSFRWAIKSNFIHMSNGEFTTIKNLYHEIFGKNMTVAQSNCNACRLKALQEMGRAYFDYKEAAEAIRYLLNKQSVQWQYALTYVAMFDFWDPEKQPKEVAYAMLDSTLRTLGQLQFTGYNEWCAVIAINKYFEAVQEDYVNVTESVYDVASKHNVVMEAMELNKPIQTTQE